MCIILNTIKCISIILSKQSGLIKKSYLTPIETNNRFNKGQKDIT